MGYVDTAALAAAPRVAGDLCGRIEIAFLRRANTRINTVVNNDDQREMGVIRNVVDGNIPASWVTLTLSLLDAAGNLTAPTDAQIDTEVVTAWNRIVKSRG
jgi:hypothetical protein